MPEKKENDLDPDICPFCGSDNVDPDGWENGEGETGPACDNCGATADSVEEWNRRPAEAALRAENNRLRNQIDKLKAELTMYIHAEYRGDHPDTVRRRNRELDAMRDMAGEV